MLRGAYVPDLRRGGLAEWEVTKRRSLHRNVAHSIEEADVSRLLPL